ncbi:hypothetical protein ACFCZQ_32150 [Streptomyces virginiae]
MGNLRATVAVRSVRAAMAIPAVASAFLAAGAIACTSLIVVHTLA